MKLLNACIQLMIAGLMVTPFFMLAMLVLKVWWTGVVLIWGLW